MVSSNATRWRLQPRSQDETNALAASPTRPIRSTQSCTSDLGLDGPSITLKSSLSVAYVTQNTGSPAATNGQRAPAAAADG